MTRFGSDILVSQFPDDDGMADPALIDLLQRVASSPTEADVVALVVALQSARFLVPVVSQVDSMEAGVEKDSHMASVTFVASDGRVGLPVFTGTDAMNDWDPLSRPVPRAALDVFRQAHADGNDAVLIDMASDHRFAVQGTMLNLLAGAIKD